MFAAARMSSTRVSAMPSRANTFAAAATIALRASWAGTAAAGARSCGLTLGIHGVYLRAMEAASPTSLARLRAMIAPAGRWIYRGAFYLVADVELDPAEAARWIPRPLRL